MLIWIKQGQEELGSERKQRFVIHEQRGKKDYLTGREFRHRYV